MTPRKLDGNAQQIFLRRQSIVDRGQNLCAFELLFRSGTQNRANIGSATAATATVINFAFNELGIESVLGSYRGFINLDAEMLLSDAIEMLPRDRVVLEMLETVEPTPEIIERVRFLRESGFTLPIADDVSDGLLHRKGRLGRLLMLAMSLERNDTLATAAVMASIPGCTAAQVNTAQAQALVWANGLAQPG